jgi:HEAT repeat protein
MMPSLARKIPLAVLFVALHVGFAATKPMLPQNAPIDELIAAAESDDVTQWSRAIDFLGRRGSEAKPAVPALIRALESPSKRESALHALAGIGPGAAEAVPVLIAGLRQWPDHSSARSVAAMALAAIGPAADSALHAAVTSPDIRISIWAHAALAKQQPENAGDHLRFLGAKLRDPNAVITNEALHAVQSLGSISAPLIRELQEASAAGRVDEGEAMSTLYRMGAAGDQIEMILPALESSDEFTRMRAAQTLAHVGSPNDKAALPVLMRLLQSSSPSGPLSETARESALEAIAWIDPNYPPARPVVLAAMNDSPWRIATTATAVALRFDRIDADLITAFVQAVRRNPPMIRSDWGNGQVLPILEMAEKFSQKLTPAHRQTAPQFVALVRDFPGHSGIQQLACRILDRLDAVPDDFVPLLVTRLRAQDYWAGSILKHLGPRASAAVSDLVAQLSEAHADQAGAARILAAIGLPAAQPAIRVLTRLAHAPQGDPSTQCQICEALLTLSPNSTTALDALDRVLKANPSHGEAPWAHFLLLKYGRKVRVHLTALDAIVAGPDERFTAGAIELRLRLEKYPQTRGRAIECALGLQESKTVDDGTREGSSRGLRYLRPSDRPFETRLAALVRSVWETEKSQDTEPPRRAVRLLSAYRWNFPSRRLLNLVAGLVRLEPATPDAKVLLAQLQAADNEPLRSAASGAPIPD